MANHSVTAFEYLIALRLCVLFYECVFVCVCEMCCCFVFVFFFKLIDRHCSLTQCCLSLVRQARYGLS